MQENLQLLKSDSFNSHPDSLERKQLGRISRKIRKLLFLLETKKEKEDLKTHMRLPILKSCSGTLLNGMLQSLLSGSLNSTHRSWVPSHRLVKLGDLLAH